MGIWIGQFGAQAMKHPRRKALGPANIRDVAARAGVSPMTVSRVINREDNVKPETRDLVNAAIRELNYAPNPAARSLAGSAPFRIGLIYNNPSAGYLSEFLVGSLDESSRAGAQLIVERAAEAEDASALVDKLVRNGVDGLILPPPLCEDPDLLAQLRSADIAVVAIAPGHENPEMATVRIDNRAAAEELTRHLISLGHRRIGFIKGAPNQADGELRLQGFQAALKEAGIDPSQAPVEQGLFTYRSGLEAAERLLARKPRPTAIFAANDDMAAAAAAHAHRLGLDVPEDISIAGFDDTSIAASVWPALTTVHQPIAAMARTAVDLVYEEIRRKRSGQGQPRQFLHPYLLVVRESSGLAPV
jgi:LacI family transcriptional regulator